jgi:4-amino-4-deoxy-L-arabinose transferase-like glycosyltransferase
MSHISSLVLTLATGLGVLWARSRRSWPLALGAGLALGVLGMSRPLEGVAVGLLVGLPLLVAALRERRASVLLAFAAGTLVTGVMGLAYNQVMTGSPLVFPAERYFDNVFGVGRYGLGFGPHKGVGWTGVDPFPGHGVRDIVVNAVLNIGMINLDLFGWWTGSVALVALGTLRARTLSDAFMVSALVLVPGLHSFYWFSGGPDFGARYWFLTILPCVVLAARGVAHLSAQDGAPRASRVELGVVLLAILAFSTFVPWRAADKYLHYRGMRPDVRVLREDPRLRGALVLVQGERHPDWASAVVYNPVEDAPEEPLFAWDRDANARRAVLAAYPERPVWIVKGPSRTHAGYEIASGPFVAAERERLAQGD